MMPRLSIRWRVRAALAVILTSAFIEMRVFPFLLRSILRMTPARDVAFPPDGDAAAWVDAALRRMPRYWRETCLKRSLALLYLLRIAGRHVELQIGARRDANNVLHAHAWLTLDGAPYLEVVQSGGYAVIARSELPSSHAR